ncbi:hypothetical protein [Moorena producens]|nr:hypothetical protein [Moorena producens]
MLTQSIALRIKVFDIDKSSKAVVVNFCLLPFASCLVRSTIYL